MCAVKVPAVIVPAVIAKVGCGEVLPEVVVAAGIESCVGLCIMGSHKKDINTSQHSTQTST